MKPPLVRKLMLVLICIATLGWVLIHFTSVDETKDISTKKTGDILNSEFADKILGSIQKTETEGKEISSQNNLNQNVDKGKYTSRNHESLNLTNSNQHTDQYVDLSSLRDLSSDGVYIVSINDIELDPDEKKDLLGKINNLKMVGSLSGGVVTHEFSDLDVKRSKLENEKASFIPIDNLLPKEFTLTSRIYSGGFSEEEGYNSVYKLYENFANGSKLEFTEMYLNPKNNAVMEVVAETLNHSIDGVPMTFETIKTPDSDIIYNAQFNLGDKYYSFSSQGISLDDFEGVLNEVIIRDSEKN